MQLEKKMSAKLDGDDGLEAVVLQRPRRVLAADEPQPKFGPVARIGFAGRSQPGSLRPVVEQELAEARALDPLEELLGDDLVGVDVGAVEHADRRRR